MLSAAKWFGGSTMRLTLYTDYALRLLMFLALRGEELTTIQEVAETYGISRNHLTKVAHELGRAGYLETMRGRGGGLRLSRPPETINLGELVRTTEVDLCQVECFSAERNTCRISPSCQLQHVLRKALAAYFAVLDEVTLADLVARPQPLQKLLAISA
jgi:Rrf2 family nitric oxide-sensitive transcriptional repressor